MVEDHLLDRQGGNPNITHTLGLNYLTQIKQKIQLIPGGKKIQTKDSLLFITITTLFIVE